MEKLRVDSDKRGRGVRLGKEREEQSEKRGRDEVETD